MGIGNSVMVEGRFLTKLACIAHLRYIEMVFSDEIPVCRVQYVGLLHSASDGNCLLTKR
jgi:hypothetical protein